MPLQRVPRHLVPNPRVEAMTTDLERNIAEMVDEDLLVGAGLSEDGDPQYRTTVKGCVLMGLEPLPDTPGPWPTLPGHE